MPVGAGTPVIPQAQLDLGPAAWWRPEADSPAGYAFAGAYETVDKQTDQLTAGFVSVFSGAGFKRYDMVYIDAAGSALIAQGRDVAVANPLFDGAPGRANGPPMPVGSPVAYVLVTEAAAVVVDITDVYQVNGFVPLQRDLDGFVVDKGTFSAATLPAPTGSSDVVTLIFASETRLPSGVAPAEPNSGGSATQAGVVTTPPLNYIWLVDQNGDEIIHTATGAKVYGRLTEAGGVWTLAYHYIDAAGAEQSVTAIETDCTVTPSALTKLVGVPKVFSRHDPARPLFDSTIARLSDQVVGDIPTATPTVQGKVIAAQVSPSPATAGAFNNAQNNGAPLAGGPFHTVNYVAGGMTSPSAGVLRIPAAAVPLQGKVLQRKFIQTSSLVALAASPYSFPPTTGQGTQIGSDFPITPVSTNSKIRARVMVQVQVQGISGGANVYNTIERVGSANPSAMGFCTGGVGAEISATAEGEYNHGGSVATQTWRHRGGYTGLGASGVAANAISGMACWIELTEIEN